VRYVVLNPVRAGMVRAPGAYPWSSYPAYINHTKGPEWLSREFIYEMLGHHQKYQGHRTYVEAGVDDEIKEFYHRGHTAAVIGDQEFINWVREGKLPEVNDKVLVAQVLPGTFSIAHIILLVADYSHMKPAVLTEIVKGPKKGLLARNVAMYMYQPTGRLSFGRNHETLLAFRILGP